MLDLKFLGFEGIQYTGLQVARDPGVTVVWSGCALLVLGIMSAFFFSYRRVWLRITPKDKRSLITLAGSSNKNREGFERKFKELVKLIKEADK
jgi:cytochrome c biogenesis protein